MGRGLACFCRRFNGYVDQIRRLLATRCCPAARQRSHFPDAVPFGAGFRRDEPDDGSDPNAEAVRASTIKLLDLVEREQIGLVIFGHDQAQWQTLKKAPAFYE